MELTALEKAFFEVLDDFTIDFISLSYGIEADDEDGRSALLRCKSAIKFLIGDMLIKDPQYQEKLDTWYQFKIKASASEADA